MSKAVMLKRAYNQALSTGAVTFSDREADMDVIRTFMADYAKRNYVKISPEEIDQFLKQQTAKWDSGLTKFSFEGNKIHVDNVSVTYTPEEMTKEEMMKQAYDDAAANAAVTFVDKVADFLVIRNSMLDYARVHGTTFDPEEVENYIRQQEAEWDSSITEFSFDGRNVTVEHVSDTYTPEPLTKEDVLRRGFAEAASGQAVNFLDREVDFMVIRNWMKDFAKKAGVDVSDEEIVNYIKESFHKMNEAVKDFEFMPEPQQIP